MALSNTPVFVQTPKVGVVQVANGDGTSVKTVYTAGANGSKVVSLTATSTDTSDRVFFVYLVRSATNYLVGTIKVPLASGSDGATAGVDLLGSPLLPGLPADNDGQRYILLQNGDALSVALNTSAVTAAKTVTFTAITADF